MTANIAIPGNGDASQPPWSELSVQSQLDEISVSCTTTVFYPIVVGELRRDLARVVESAVDRYGCTSTYVVADEHAVGTLADAVADVASRCGLQYLGASVLDGREFGKSEETVTQLWSQMHQSRVMRRSLIIGVGGGVICDVTGFAASTYMRGLPYALVPTTLMGQVDAAIGGKTGFNFAGQKNLVGSFYHPAGVVVDPSLLDALPDRVFRAGLAEMIKIGVIGRPDLFTLIAERDLDSLRQDSASVDLAIRLAISEKLRHLQRDPFEVRDLRRALNFGHCVGHAIEAECGYEWLHGECVAVGMAVACRVGTATGVSNPRDADRVLSALSQLGLPRHVPDELADAVWAHLEKIARVRNGTLNLVIPASIGTPIILPDWPSEIAWDDVR